MGSSGGGVVDVCVALNDVPAFDLNEGEEGGLDEGEEGEGKEEDRAEEDLRADEFDTSISSWPYFWTFFCPSPDPVADVLISV